MVVKADAGKPVRICSDNRPREDGGSNQVLVAEGVGPSAFKYLWEIEPVGFADGLGVEFE